MANVPVLLEAPPIIAEHVKSGRLIALAVTGRQRSPLLPDTARLLGRLGSKASR